VLGTDDVDNLLFFCYRPHAETGPGMDFAGLSGNGNTPYPNPVTGKYGTCPSGYNRYSTYGTPNVDHNLFTAVRLTTPPVSLPERVRSGLANPLLATP
jgi:hypothetical protein